MKNTPNTTRIVALDLLRGFALLGIFLMNSVSFAMPMMAYFNPLAYGGTDWLNRSVHGLLHIFADQKFMALFSLLFGAGVLLVLQRLEQKGEKKARFHYRRNAWLLLFGALHGALLWDGDILLVYALCAFVLYFFHRYTARTHFIGGLLLYLSPALLYWGSTALLSLFSAQDLQALQASWQPSAEANQLDIQQHLQDYGAVFYHRMAGPVAGGNAVDLFFLNLIFEIFARALGMMLMGMALYRWGLLSAQWSEQNYRRLLWGGLSLGFVLAGGGLLWNEVNHWQVSQALFLGRLPNLLATPCLAGAYIALIMLWSKSQLWQGLQSRVAAVGRMAFSNYIGQTLIGTTLFYGYGFGLFGSLSRFMLLGVVFVVWLIQLWLSPWWLARFQFGPLEWLWRSLAYRKRQPLRISEPQHRV